MITRKMNERITFYETKTTKDENGDPITIEKDLFSCWCEVAKATTKEFRDRSSNKIEEIQKQKNVRTFYVRFRTDVQTDMLINWRSQSFKVIDFEEDWKSKDMLMITAEVIE